MSKRTGQGRYQTLASDPGVGVGKEEGNPHSWRTSSQHTPMLDRNKNVSAVQT